MASPKQTLSPLLTYKTAEDSLVIDAFFEIFHLGLCLATTGTYFTSCVSQLTPLLRGQSSLRSPCYLHNDILSFALTTIGFPVFRFPDALPGGEVTIRYKQSFLRFMYRSIERAIRASAIITDPAIVSAAITISYKSAKHILASITATKLYQLIDIHIGYFSLNFLEISHPLSNRFSLGFQLFGVHSNSSSGWMLKTVLIRQAVCGRFLRHCYWVFLLSQP
jgi:hypothetical protein